MDFFRRNYRKYIVRSDDNSVNQEPESSRFSRFKFTKLSKNKWWIISGVGSFLFIAVLIILACIPLYSQNKIGNQLHIKMSLLNSK
jgi:hypothetical protein